MSGTFGHRPHSIGRELRVNRVRDHSPRRFRVSRAGPPRFASPVAGLGSKIGIAATNKWPGETSREWGRPIERDAATVAAVDKLWPSLGL